MPALTREDYQFRMAMCVLANLKVGIPIDKYADLKIIIQNADLETAIAAVDKNGASEVATSIRNVMNGAKDWQVKQVANGDDKALILKCDGEVQICFPGTIPKDISMLESDADALPVNFEAGGIRCKVDQGFLDRANNLKQPIEEALGTLECNRININGYSLGAGVAMLSVLGLESNWKDKIHTVCTFATPHIGDRHFAKAVEKELADGGKKAGKVVNVRNTEDPITYVPPWFRNSPGGNISIDGNGNIVPEGKLQARKSRREVWKIWSKIKHDISCLDIKHHLPSAYFKGLEKLPENPSPSTLLTSSKAKEALSRLTARGRQ